MKTILYQPLFINPQAYFVFPQLYHIEKGDSYIEPANITGQLIINNLSEGLTLTPTVNVIQDSNQVDFSLFKGKHIRISQYTNIGAVVLGEWYIPGTPTPPKPEQPDWFKESIVAWYSPYCKQGMTNYDVIESYLIDLTRGVINSEHGDASINGQKINITNIKVKAKDIFAIIPGKTEYTLKLHVSGQTKTNQTRLIYQTKDNKYISHYLNNGINTLWLTNVAWIAIEGLIVGECNITIAQLPTSILKDFSGNNHDAYLHGFKGKLDSGIGIYKIDFSKTLNASAFDNFERLNNKVIAKGNYSGNWNVFGEYDINGIVKNKVAIKITGLNNIKEKLFLEYGYFTTDSKYIKNIILIDKDGIYTYDLNDIIIPDGSNIAYTILGMRQYVMDAFNRGNIELRDIGNIINNRGNGSYKYTIYLLCGENIPIAKRVLNIDITDSDKGKTPYFYINPGKNYGFEVYRESPNGKKEVVVGFSSVNDVETLSFQDFSDCALIGEHDSTWSSMKTSVLLWKPVKDDIPDKTLYPHFFYNQGVLVSTSGNLKSPLTDFLAIPYLNVGVTSQRPGNADNGFQFFDMTLRKPIWWNGSSWVDANGATV